MEDEEQGEPDQEEQQEHEVEGWFKVERSEGRRCVGS